MSVPCNAVATGLNWNLVGVKTRAVIGLACSKRTRLLAPVIEVMSVQDIVADLQLTADSAADSLLSR
jgi:hypothetical protein